MCSLVTKAQVIFNSLVFIHVVARECAPWSFMLWSEKKMVFCNSVWLFIHRNKLVPDVLTLRLLMSYIYIYI